MILKPERIDDLSPEEYGEIIKRSSTDITSIYEKVREIVLNVRENGEGVFLDYYKKGNPDLTPEDLEVIVGVDKKAADVDVSARRLFAD